MSRCSEARKNPMLLAYCGEIIVICCQPLEQGNHGQKSDC